MVLFKKRGFTLIELMVVIAIIAVLSAVVAPQVFRQVAKGRVSSVEKFTDTVKLAATSFFSDTGIWPASCTETTCNTNSGGFVNGTTGTLGWDGPYLDRWPAANANPWSGNYTWVNATSAIFGTSSGERYITVTNAAQAGALKIDTDIDGAIDNATGKVRYANATTTVVNILISRDGVVN